jgi:hypothetical protein
MSLFQQRDNRGTKEGFTNMEKTGELGHSSNRGTEAVFSNIEKTRE